MTRPHLRFARTLVVLLAIIAAHVGSVQAAPGDLDTSFSGDGKVLETGLATGSTAAVAIQTDGKIVAVGTAADDFLVMRYIRAGTLDPTFGGDGIVTTSFGSSLSIDNARGVAIQADGKIVVAGRAGSASNAQIGLARYNTDGTLDTTFSGDGIHTMEFSSSGSAGGAASGVVVLANGRIVIAGSDGTVVALAGLNANGTLDATFGPPPGGRTTRDFTGVGQNATAIAIQSDGRIIVAGTTTLGDQDVFVWDRFSANGFQEGLQGGNLGNAASHTNFGPNTDARANSVAVQPDGKVVLAGDFTFTGGGGQVPIFTSDAMAIARYNADGAMDATFSDDGLRTIDFGLSAFARAVAIQPDGKMVVAGRAITSGLPLDFALARLNASGSLDTSFSGDGLLTTDFSSGGTSRNDFGSALAIQRSDGRIVVAGSADSTPGVSGGSLVALARYHAFTCNGANVTILGTNGPDTITGTSKPDVIHGLGGNDVLTGDPAFGGSGDTICDGIGSDTLRGGPGNDTLVAQAGADNLNGGEGTDVCLGNNARLDPLDIFAQCETISTGGAGVSGEWERIDQKCNSSPNCRLDGSLRVFNPGGEHTAVASQVAFYLSEDQALDEGDVFLTLEDARALDAGEATIVKLKAKLPEGNDASGYYVIAVVDFFNNVAEVNEDNNLAVSGTLSTDDGAH